MPLSDPHFGTVVPIKGRPSLDDVPQGSRPATKQQSYTPSTELALQSICLSNIRQRLSGCVVHSRFQFFEGGALLIVVYSQVPPLVVILYDHLLTLDREIRLVWGAQRNCAKVLLLFVSILIIMSDD